MLCAPACVVSECSAIQVAGKSMCLYYSRDLIWYGMDVVIGKTPKIFHVTDHVQLSDRGGESLL